VGIAKTWHVFSEFCQIMLNSFAISSLLNNSLSVLRILIAEIHSNETLTQRQTLLRNGEILAVKILSHTEIQEQSLWVREVFINYEKINSKREVVRWEKACESVNCAQTLFHFLTYSFHSTCTHLNKTLFTFLLWLSFDGVSPLIYFDVPLFKCKFISCKRF